PRTERGIDPAQTSAGIEVVKGQSETELEHRGIRWSVATGKPWILPAGSGSRHPLIAIRIEPRARCECKEPAHSASAIIRRAAVTNALDYVPRAKREIGSTDETVLRTTGRDPRCGSAGRGNRFGTTDQARRAQQLQDLPGFPRAVQEGHGACSRGDQRVGRAPRTTAGTCRS